ncbi:uncharacterized protein N7484_000297 [Penicillium longicatenatum]|uniref:uncharacterized protein n=1 Tax=Penicillium longicatenatum TaxID=1561947 RepID=UPI0025493743|nr:uncharacterized protein N7484_000297 [Penicillium longicatenatum]KAJ5660925.1 hypothetical protein N7484_000297 [Penicillium longicatenatum]
MSLKVGSIDVLQRSIEDPNSDPRYDGPEPSLTILEKGFRKEPDAAAFQIATVFEKDVKISLRDGVKIRADIFRPQDDVKVPVLIAWSPYGKTGRGINPIEMIPGRVGVPKSRLSKFEKFEAPDPAEWTARGYAIANVDARGVYDSEGNVRRRQRRIGNLLQNINIPLQDLKLDANDVEPINPLKYLGPSGCLRASHAAIDKEMSTSSFPEHDYSSRAPVLKGKIVKLEIGIWQTGMVFDAGEKLVLRVSGHSMTLAEFVPLRGQLANGNVGKHHVHCGGENQSKLVIPLVEV